MPAALVEKIQSLIGSANVLTGAALSPYVVEGSTPEAAAFPGTVDEVRAVVEAAAGTGTPVIPWGGGTASSVGTPIARPGLVLALNRLARILEHEPGDLTATVEAGLTIAALGQALAARGQWLSLDPPEPERATVGGVIAANASGPRRHLYGTARDLVIGITVVTGEGALVRGGGKVVKNVAGYDLPKLFVGSGGTLGIIVEATVKLRPLPDLERFARVRFERLKDAGAATRTVMASDLIPSALELTDSEASGVGVPALVVGFDGLPEQVVWQCTELERILGPVGGHHVEAADETALTPRPANAAAATMKLAVLPGQVADVMEQGAVVARARGLTSAFAAHAGVGVITAHLSLPSAPGDASALAAVLGEWRKIARGSGGYAVLERAPLAVKALVPVWDDPGGAGRIMQRIKAQIDPHNILNPGRFVAGI